MRDHRIGKHADLGRQAAVAWIESVRVNAVARPVGKQPDERAVSDSFMRVEIGEQPDTRATDEHRAQHGGCGNDGGSRLYVGLALSD